MSISQYIQNEVLLSRAKQQGVLVVYDPEQRYRDLCIGLAADELLVVDGSESSIESREAAIEALTAAEGVPSGKSLLVYLPNPAPITDQDSQVDPFAPLGLCGAVFPGGDGDEYLNLCLKYRPDHEGEIRQIFAENPDPEFAIIDNVGGGISWPTLQHLLGAASAIEILTALIAPSSKQRVALGQSKTWVNEAKSLLSSVLGQSLRTRAKSLGPIVDELWRFVLFSEFVFDLPEPLPAALGDVPRAEPSSQLLIEALCDRLRNDRRSQAVYIERAEAVEKELNLVAHCVDIKDLGQRDTFPFEERSIFTRAVEAVQRGDLEAVHAIVYRHSESIWRGRGESQAQWELLKSAVELIDSCEEHEKSLPHRGGDQASLLAFYRGSLRECDRLQREFEQAFSEYLDLEGTGVLTPVVEVARHHYRRLAERTQLYFTENLERSGWPPVDGLANADVFDRLVAPKLRERGRRVAYLMVDALRYELGLALYQQLAEDDITEIQAAYAQLPTVTLVGMNSLLPGAGQGLSLAEDDGRVVPELDGVRLKTVAHRMAVFKRLYGDRFQELELNKFVRGRAKVEETIELLVLRSLDIDSHLENDPESTLSLLQDTLKRIRVAINKLRKAGFKDVVIVTDHGFFLNAQGDAGDLCSKPAGTWVNVHERALLGSGTPDDHNYVLDADRVGIRGDFPQLGGPRTMAPYSRGMLYFHGGASLQEAVVPVITVALKEQEKSAARIARVQLNYKEGASKVTTRRPVVEVCLEGDMFAASQETSFEILLEAQKRNGEVVGEAAIGGPVNAATGTIELRPGDTLKVPIRMQEEFEGKFKLKALDPKTNEVFAELALETDYTV